jgi:hypothetical protein
MDAHDPAAVSSAEEDDGLELELYPQEEVVVVAAGFFE